MMTKYVYVPEAGDIAACWGTCWVSKGISAGTSSLLGPKGLRWAPSHVAIMAEHSVAETLWVESTTLNTKPCLIGGGTHDGVQAHRPHERIREYTSMGGRVDIYRLVPIDKLQTIESKLLSRLLYGHFLGVRYDTGGALLSGIRTRTLHHLLMPHGGMGSLFCSELVAACLMRLGRLNRDCPTRFNPGRLMRRLVRQGTYYKSYTFGQPDES